uniref:Uncharacterized protein n=1 Tax=Oryzias melastigma TaxID=30732 RepID=A0A3B3CMA1_ORYME
MKNIIKFRRLKKAVSSFSAGQLSKDWFSEEANSATLVVTGRPPPLSVSRGDLWHCQCSGATFAISGLAGRPPPFSPSRGDLCHCRCSRATIAILELAGRPLPFSWSDRRHSGASRATSAILGVVE